jgi:hypothetical protein
MLENVAQELNIPPETLWRESLEAYIARESRLIELDTADFQDRYNVTSPEQLKAKIESGDIYSHPAWEELIEWENLLAYQERLEKLQASLE